MLIKSICKRCYEESTGFEWNNNFQEVSNDECWRIGLMFCPSVYVGIGGFSTKIDKSPPKDCPYALEHTVLNQEGCHAD